MAYTDRVTELGIAPSVGPRGDSYDNGLAEAVNAAYKSEFSNRGKPWRYIDDVELSTAEWVSWYNRENTCTRPPATFHQPRTRPPSPAPHNP